MSSIIGNNYFNLDEFLGPSTFPRSLDDGQKAVEKASSELTHEVEKILKIPANKRTFDNTVMAYHRQMNKFDAVERVIRSERLLFDETPGKLELLQRCTSVKEALFTDRRLLTMFIQFAQTQSGLSAVQQQYLKGIIGSINEETCPQELLQTLSQVKGLYQELEGTQFAYLPGECASKVLTGKKREFTYLTVNLCMMQETTSMICGGILPWPMRIDAIVAKIKALNPDILLLQEVYEVDALHELHARLKSSYAHFLGNVTPRVMGLSGDSFAASSGLAIISKFALENVRFDPYRHTVKPDSVSGFDRLKLFGYDRNYGLFHGIVKNGTEPMAIIATTHQNPFFADLRGKQMEQVVEVLAREAQQHPNVPVLLCGDFNNELGDLKETSEQLQQAHFANHYNHEGPTWYNFGNYWLERWHGRSDKIEKMKSSCMSETDDRSLVWSKWAVNNSYTMKVQRVLMFDPAQPQEALSDHHGLMTRFSYSKSRARVEVPSNCISL